MLAIARNHALWKPRGASLTPTYYSRRLSYRSIIRTAVALLLAFFCSAFVAIRTDAAPPHNPVPIVDIFSPVSITPGSTGVTLTIPGTGYVAGSKVHWNGTALTTTFVSAKKLTAVVPDALVAAVGLGTVTVVSPGLGGGTSNVFYIPVASTLLSTSFLPTPSSSVTVGTRPTGLLTGDFNGDGQIDLAIANSGSNTVSILLGNGGGSSAVTDTLIVRTSGGDRSSARNGDREIGRNSGWRSAPLFAVGMPLAGILLVGLRFPNGKRSNGKSRLWIILLVACMGVTLYGCAIVSRARETPAGTYILTVTGTGSTVQHATTVTLTVNP
jgi:hypothetical protein